MNDSKNEQAWKQLFEKYNICEAINKNGQYIISSKDINKFREARLMTKFDYRFQLPHILAEKRLSILPISRGEYVLSNIETFEDLKNTPSYIKWLESGGKMGFPNGESSLEMKKRCINAFETIKKDMLENNINTAAVFTHGGTIMAVCEYITGDFYGWHIKNGAAVKVTVENEKVKCEKI